MRRLYNLLRSRKLAFWLIGAFTLYAAVATTITEDDYASAYATPLFVAIAAALALATAACAWERTQGAIRLWRSGAAASPGFIERLEKSPQIVVPLPEDADPEIVLGRVAAGFSGDLRLRARGGKGRLLGTSGRVGLAGSPVFHWALVALFVLVIGGRLTRSEGMMGVPVGSERHDAAEAYGTLEEGPLHSSRFSGLTIAVPELEFGYVVDGIDYDAPPLVELWDGDRLVTRQLVHPNKPARAGSVMVHAVARGLAASFVLEGTDSTETVDVLYDFSSDAIAARPGSPLVLTRGDTTVTVATEIELDVVDDARPWKVPDEPRVTWTVSEGATESTGTVAIGERIPLSDGASLQLERVTDYARLSVVDDWSVYPMYAVLVIAAIGLGVALVLPPRSVWVMLVDGAQGRMLHARTRQSRADRVFPSAVEDVLCAAAEGEDVS